MNLWKRVIYSDVLNRDLDKGGNNYFKIGAES